MKNYLNFESELKSLEDELDKLKDPYNQDGLSEVNTVKIGKVEEEINQKLKKIYLSLDPWQTTLVARHDCLLYTSPSPRDISGSRMPSSA